ncbi:hypothetical protein D770_22505 [Flammeovirgaceae bacterium 311]|nr:hypothetical protein D770_22505 [Flammeovirgaceae bacterium 311]
MGVTFAQTTPETDPQQNTEQSITVDPMSNRTEDAGRRSIQVEELPEAVQTNLQSDEFKNFSVVTVTEIQPVEGAAVTAVQYEVALAEGAAVATAEPTVIVLFDENGKVVSQGEPAEQKEEEEK